MTVYQMFFDQTLYFESWNKSDGINAVIAFTFASRNKSAFINDVTVYRMCINHNCIMIS